MLHYATLITLQLQQLLLLPQLQQQVQLHRTTLHCTNYTAAHYNYKYKCDYNYITLHYATQRYTTLITLHYATTTTTTATTIATTTTLQYTTLH